MSLTDQLATLLASEIECLQRLLDTLEREYQALTAADVESLEVITREKNTTMTEQAALASQRGRLLVAANFTDSNQGLQDCIAASGNPPSLNAALQTLGSLAEQCQQHNRENGRLILQKQEQAQVALNILRQTDGVATTYSGEGVSAASEDSRTLGKA